MKLSFGAPGALRALAILIALAGVVDPAVTALHTTKPIVAVVAGDQRGDSAGAGRVARALAKDFIVTPGPFPRADATVLAGDHLPRSVSDIASPAFALIPDERDVRI